MPLNQAYSRVGKQSWTSDQTGAGEGNRTLV